MTDMQQKLAIKQFVKDWTGYGDKKQEPQRFWICTCKMRLAIVVIKVNENVNSSCYRHC